MLFKERLTELSVDYAITDYELRIPDRNVEDREQLEEILTV